MTTSDAARISTTLTDVTSTGASLGTRKHYSDDEEHLVRACAPLVLNGIPDLATRSDFVDRAVVIKLGTRPKDLKRTDEEVKEAFTEVWPSLLGALFDGVAKALQLRDEVKAEMRRNDPPRMFDFAAWAEAGGRAYGWQSGEWLSAYQENRLDVATVTIDSDPIVEPLKKLVRAGGLRHTASEILERLEAYVSERTRKDRSWPKNPKALAERLRRLSPGLRRAGFVIYDDKSPDRDRRRLWVIEYAEEEASLPSSSQV